MKGSEQEKGSKDEGDSEDSSSPMRARCALYATSTGAKRPSLKIQRRHRSRIAAILGMGGVYTEEFRKVRERVFATQK